MTLLKGTFRTPLAKAAGLVLIFFGLVAVFANVAMPQSPYVQNVNQLLAHPSWHHLLGTDYLGRDNLSRIILGTRSSLLGALEAVAIGFGIGAPAGIASVFLGRAPQFLVMRVVDALMTIPAIVFAIGAVAVIGESQAVAMGAIGVLFAPHVFRVVRAATLTVANSPFVEVADLFGAGRPRVIVTHIWRKVLPTLAVTVASQIAAGILAVSSLAYLGIGSQPPLPTWGSMLSDDMGYLAPAGWEPIFPGLAIVLIVGSLSLIADALRDVTRAGGQWVEVAPRRRRPGGIAARSGRGAADAATVLEPRAGGTDLGGHLPAEPVRVEGRGEALLEVRGLTVSVPSAAGSLAAVRDVSFSVRRGTAVGLVGESGSGKTLTCRSVLGVLPPGCAVTGGSIELAGTELTALDRTGWQHVHGSRIGAIFQDPASYLNPSVPVGRQLVEVLRVKVRLRRPAARRRAIELMEAVGLQHAQFVFHQLPSELSGGMLQRMMIAIAVATEPDLLIADEATTALDALTQAAVIDLLRELRDRLGLAILFVSHDLAVVSELCDEVVVLYGGEVVETATCEQLLADPVHPYSAALLRVGLPPEGGDKLASIPGQPPAVDEVLPGCRFAPRCPFVSNQCTAAAIELRTLAGARQARCVRTAARTSAGEELVDA